MTREFARIEYPGGEVEYRELTETFRAGHLGRELRAAGIEARVFFGTTVKPPEFAAAEKAEIEVGGRVAVEHIGKTKVGIVKKVGRTRVVVEVAVGRGAAARTKEITRPIAEVEVVRAF